MPTMTTVTTTKSLHKLISRPALLLLLVSLLFSIVACGGPPEEALDGAEKALLNAAFAKDCAEETYRSAQRMLEEAKIASADGRYEEARRKADASRMLAEQARADTEANPEKCNKEDEGKIAKVNIAPPEVDPTDNYDPGEAFELKVIFFPFDEATLTSDARRDLDSNAKWLLKNPKTKVTIEGHTDDQGSTEYNLALSQRRAQTVKQYIQRLGVSGERVRTIPFGEESPAKYGSGEGARSKNRRAVFLSD